MSWSKLAPIMKTGGRPMASASVVVNKAQEAKISLILSSSLVDEFIGPARADVSAGEGEDHGSLLLEFHPQGAFEVRGFVAGGGRLFLPLFEGIPGAAVNNAPCTLGDKVLPSEVVCATEAEFRASGGSVVIKLPLAAWTQDRADRRTPARPAATTDRPPPPPKVGNGEPLDVVAYLKGKGVRIERLAGDRFQLDGATVTMGAVLNAVNKQRDDAGLLPLSRVEVR